MGHDYVESKEVDFPDGVQKKFAFECLIHCV